MPVERLDFLLAYAIRDGRVCPMPEPWNKLHRIIGRPRSLPPLILAAWGSPEWAKARRLREQIQFAAEHGTLDRVDRFLRRLAPDEWYVEPMEHREREPLIDSLIEAAVEKKKALARAEAAREEPRARRQLTLFDE